MNLIPQEENKIEQTSALDQTTTTPSAQEATTSPANTPETSDAGLIKDNWKADVEGDGKTKCDSVSVILTVDSTIKCN